MRLGVIINPNSKKNRHDPDRAARLQTLIEPYGTVYTTEHTRDIAPVVRQLLRQNVSLLVSDGGDGALHWLLRNLIDVMDEPEFEHRPLPLVMPTNAGTIDFVAKAAGIKGNADQVLAAICKRLQNNRALDVAEVESMRISGLQKDASSNTLRPFRALGFASAVGGTGQRFFRKYYASNDQGAAKIVKVLARVALSFALARGPLKPHLPSSLQNDAAEFFNPTLARVNVDGVDYPWTSLLALNIASLSINLGGVVRFFPQAQAESQLNAIFGAPSAIACIRNVPRMVLGKPLKAPRTLDTPCQTMTVEKLSSAQECLAPVIDGEFYEGVHKISFELGPKIRIPIVDARHV